MVPGQAEPGRRLPSPPPPPPPPAAAAAVRPAPRSPALIGSAPRPGRSLAARAATREQQGRWCLSRAQNHLTRSGGGGRRSHEEGGPARPSPLPSTSARTSVLPSHAPCSSPLPCLLRTAGGHSNGRCTPDMWENCSPTPVVVAQPIFTDARDVLGHKGDKTGTNSDPACPQVARRLIKIGPLRAQQVSAE
ncbi:translation initiation factor IF-2-like [Equus quagga]|uniref:translation initiation factor IF-2-like n=1 Tax=Equus quagga TaxID=89248 RepID=UPI001EE15FB3|nr:translation initiation factor IF-2-like [Equus quagga]